MTVQSKSVIKSYFETGDSPSQAQFADLVDSYQDVLTSAGSNGVIVAVSGNTSTVSGTNGQILTSNGPGVAPSFQTSGGGTGTVTSAGLSMPNIFAVAGSPITSQGVFTVTLSAQAQKQIFVAPVSSTGAPTFRLMVDSDLPTTAVSAGTYTSPTIIINDKGRITSATNGSSGSGLQPQITVFTASGTFTTSANITTSTRFKFTVTGGGGGGGSSGTSVGSGGGGGAGGTAIYEVSGLTPSTGYTVVVGTGGAQGVNGIDSTIVIGATTVTGVKGLLGTDGGGSNPDTGGSGGTGGTATNGTINISGGDGGSGTGGPSTNAAQYGGGSGGASFWGGGGRGIGTASASAGVAYGSGGGGGRSNSAGGAGKAGIVIAEWFE